MTPNVNSTTLFECDIKIGYNFQSNKIILGQNGNITADGSIRLNTGDINIYNANDSKTISLTNDGKIDADEINVDTITTGKITTNANETQTIEGSIINIGHAILLPPSLSTINLNGSVYINGVLLLPFSSASSFFSQWT